MFDGNSNLGPKNKIIKGTEVTALQKSQTIKRSDYKNSIVEYK